VSDDAAPRTSVTTFKVIDGGMATELAARGLDIPGDLWSARVLVDAPEAIEAVHYEYFEAGAEVTITASYQASYEGFRALGLSSDETTRLLHRSVTIAKAARERFRARHPEVVRSLLVAASIGPFGATRHDGSEYRGDYGLTEAELVSFHRERFAAVVAARPDLLACETIPSLLEARALVHVLRAHPTTRAWVSFTCRDARHTAAGDEIAACARFLDAEAQVVAMGANCVDPAIAESIVREFAGVTRKPVIVYPNSGERWNAITRSWEGTPARFSEFVPSWIGAGASWIGGCCRTTPEDIRAIRSMVDRCAT
jgi:homocysteine S-methyltransferase